MTHYPGDTLQKAEVGVQLLPFIQAEKQMLV